MPPPALGGLDDFGSDGWQEPLDVLCRCLATEAGLSRFGKVSLHTQVVQFLKNRLLVAELIRRNPAILDQPVVAPMFIAGLPRTGTTHLHQLMSADPALRFLPYWESIEPVPAPGEPLFGDGSMAPRLARCEEGVGYSELWAPEIKRMHEISTWHAHEEIHLLSIDCSSMYFDTLALIPSWREYYRSADQTPHYRYLRTMLQVLQFLRGGDRWILKSPQHLEQFGVLADVFPDGSFFITHRDPGSVLVSLATMLSYAGADPRRDGRIPSRSAGTGATSSPRCSSRRSTIVTCCPRIARSTSRSTSSWPTTSPPSPGATRSPVSRSTPGRPPPTVATSRPTSATATVPSSTTRPMSASTPTRSGPGSPGTASGSVSEDAAYVDAGQRRTNPEVGR